MTESRCGYYLPDGSRLFPAVAWIPGPESDPKFVVDVLSPRDRVELSCAKMAIWLANGVELGWMIEPQHKAVTIYRPNQEPERLIAPDRIAGEGSIDGFVLDVVSIWV